MRVVAIGCGDSHSMVLTDDGRVFGWGTFRDKSGVFGARTFAAEATARALARARAAA